MHKIPMASLRSIYGDHERYKDTYFTIWLLLHRRRGEKENGMIRITGRVDDVINVSGHRIGTAEVEDAINTHELVVESAVIGYSHPIKGKVFLLSQANPTQ